MSYIDFERKQEEALKAKGLTLWKTVDGQRVEVPFTTEWPVHVPRSFAGVIDFERWATRGAVWVELGGGPDGNRVRALGD